MESLFTGLFVTWCYFSYCNYERETFKGTSYQLFYFLTTAFSLAFVSSTMVVLIQGVKVETNYDGQISMLWSLTLYEIFKDYLVYRPKRSDYDLIACKTN